MSELVRQMRYKLDEAADCIEAMDAALHDAFMAMCSHRDNPDDEIFQDAIDALGLVVLDKDAEK